MNLEKDLLKVKNKQSRQWANDYFIHLSMQNRSPLTVLNYRSDIIQFLIWLEKAHQKDLLSINADTINFYLRYLKKHPHSNDVEIHKKNRPNLLSFFKKLFKKSPETTTDLTKVIERSEALSPASLRRHISVIRNFFEFLKQKHEDLPGKEGDKFAKNPVKSKLHQVKLKDTDIFHTVYLSPDDFKKLDLLTTKPSDRVLIYVLYYGGLRLREAQQLSFAHFDYDLGMANIIRKGGDRHQLYFHQFAPVKEELNRLTRAENRTEGPLFISQKTGQALTTRALAFRLEKLFLKAGVTPGVAPHSFRKARATELYLETHDLLYVRDYLNHADAKVTQTYIDQKALNRNQRMEYLKNDHFDELGVET